MKTQAPKPCRGAGQGRHLEAKHPPDKALIYGVDAAGRRALYVAPHSGIPAFLKRDKAPKADPTAAAMTELRKIAESTADLDPSSPTPTRLCW